MKGETGVFNSRVANRNQRNRLLVDENVFALQDESLFENDSGNFKSVFMRKVKPGFASCSVSSKYSLCFVFFSAVFGFIV